MLKADTAINAQKIAKFKADLAYCEVPAAALDAAREAAAPARKRTRRSGPPRWPPTRPSIKEAQAEEVRARLRYTSEIGGVNTTVAAIQAELDQARYYLDNTLMVAPEDGYIMNLQVRPGMVAGDVRFGAIASFICDADRYLLANYFQENLKYVKPGQAVEVALDLYPGQILPGKVAAIWQGSGAGQMLPSGTLAQLQLRADRDAAGAVRRWRSRSTMPTRRSSRSARRGGPRSTPTRTAPSWRCARSRSAPTPGSTGCIRSPADATHTS